MRQSDSMRQNVCGQVKFTIIIPTYNRDEDLEACLKSLKDNSSYENEVIVLYNMNKKTNEICDKYGAKSVYDNARKNGKRVKSLWGILNDGVKAAKNDFVMYLNDDCLVLPGWDKVAAHYFKGDESLGLLVLKTKGIGQDPNFRIVEGEFGLPCANYAILNKKSKVCFDGRFNWFFGDADLPCQIVAFSSMNVSETKENMIVHNHRVDDNRRINENKLKEFDDMIFFKRKWFFYELIDKRLKKRITVRKLYHYFKDKIYYQKQRKLLK